MDLLRAKRTSSPSIPEDFSYSRFSRQSRIRELQQQLMIQNNATSVLPSFLSRQSQINQNAEEQFAIAEKAAKERDAPTGPRKRIGILIRRHQFLLLDKRRGKLAKKRPTITTSFYVPTCAKDRYELIKQVEAELQREKHRMIVLTETIKAAQKRARNVANFKKMLADKQSVAFGQ
mmetsp:Transcript_12498/g.22435  ORF Transcript_12498/g.22435 Transcript_12498/m.22435 type:complete len:176 (+) Transcript_12498:74-601(+)